MATPLSAEKIESALSDLPGWGYSEGKLHKKFKFGSFKEAVSFIVRIAFEAEDQNHHPELTNIYSTVDIALSTHDAGDKVTEKDIKLARAIQSLSWVG